MVGFRGPFCRSLYEYWLGLPKPRGSLLPLKSALDPTAIPRLLSRVVLHDLRHPGRSILRLVGTGMAEQYGFDPTGRDYLDLVAPERRDSALDQLRKIAAHPCGMRVLIEGLHDAGRSILDEAAGFPFEADDGSGRFLLFVDEPLEQRGVHDPRRKPLTSLRVLEREFIDIGAGVPPLDEVFPPRDA
ncbi:MAG TPA: PAS domain-containing protein [Thalassobaculum sp.]